MQINSDRIQATNWKIGHVLEDCRNDSSTRGDQFEITDWIDKKVELRQLSDEERVIPNLIFSRIK